MAVTVTLLGKNKLSGPFGKGTRTIAGMGRAIGGLGLKFAKFGTIAGVAIAGISIKLAADLGDGLREVGTLMGGLTDNQMKNMTKELESLAASSGKAIDTLVKAKYDIVSAGFTDAAESAELLKIAADLAVGGVAEISTTADLLTTAINAYGDAALSASETSDKLFTIVRLGKTTISELGGSMGRLLSVAAQTGVNLDEVGASLATLTAAGQSTEEAVTAIRASIIQMIKPTEDLAGLINDLGFASGTALIEAEGFAGAIQLIKEEADKSGTPMTDLFNNVRAMQAVLPLTGTAAKKFEENLVEMGKAAGATAGAVEEMQKSFSQDMRKLRQNVNNILREIGRSLIEILQPKIKEANEILSTLGEIGWDVVAKTVVDNWRLVLDAVLEITEVMAPAIGTALKTGVITGLRGLVSAIGQMLIKMLETSPFDVLFGEKTENVGQAFQGMGDTVGEIITTLLSQIKQLAEEGTPALKELGDTVETVAAQSQAASDKVTTATEDLGSKQIEAFSNVGSAITDLASINKSASKENFKIWKRAAQAQALVDTYAGGIAAFKALAGIPLVGPFLGAAAAAAAIAGGLARVALIEGTKFQFGGRVPSRGIDTVPALLAPGEIVSTQQASNLFGPQIAQMNQMAEGLGGAQGGGGDTFIINALDAQSFENMLKRNGLALGRGIRQATRDRNLSMTDLP